MRHLYNAERLLDDQGYRGEIKNTLSLSEDAQAVQREYESDLQARGEIDRDEMGDSLEFNKDAQRVQIAHEHQVNFQKVIDKIERVYSEQDLKRYALELAKETNLLNFQSNPENPEEWIVVATDSKNESAKGLVETINQRKADFECAQVEEKIWLAKTDRELEIIAYELDKKGLVRKINTERGWYVEKTEHRNSSTLFPSLIRASKALNKVEYNKALNKVKDAQTDRELEAIAYDLHKRGLLEKINDGKDWHVWSLAYSYEHTIGEPLFKLIYAINGRHATLTGVYERQADEYEEERRKYEEEIDELLGRIEFAQTDRELEVIAYALHQRGVLEKINTGTSNWHVERNGHRNSEQFVDAINERLTEMRAISEDEDMD